MKTRKLHEVVLGERYRETLHGIEGIATCYAHYLTGCDKVCLERLDKDEKVEDYWVDVTLIEGVEALEQGPGGPAKIPPK